MMFAVRMIVVMGALVTGDLVTVMMGTRVMDALVTGLRRGVTDTLTMVLRRTLFITAMRRTPITNCSSVFGILFGATFFI